MFTKKPERGRQRHEDGGTAGERPEDSLHRAAGDLCRQEPDPERQQDGPLDHR